MVSFLKGYPVPQCTGGSRQQACLLLRGRGTHVEGGLHLRGKPCSGRKLAAQRDPRLRSAAERKSTYNFKKESFVTSELWTAERNRRKSELLMLLSEALGGVWRLLPTPSAGSLENAAAWQVSMLQTERAQGRVFPARKLASTVSLSFPISTLEPPGWPPLMSWSASARESQEAEGRL